MFPFFEYKLNLDSGEYLPFRPHSRSFESYLLSSSVVIKVGMVGDSAIGKTSLMVKYVEGAFDEDYIQTLGTNSRLSINLI